MATENYSDMTVAFPLLTLTITAATNSI